MCGRYDLSATPAALRAEFALPAVPQFAPNADLRPTQRAPVVHLDRDGARVCSLMRWGLVPAWADGPAFGARCINARRETLASAPAFRDAYRRRRCLVPVTAFYEWSGPKGARIRWRIALSGAPLFALAGLWSVWRDRAAGAAAPWLETYTVITRPAVAALAPIHDRMPVIVPGADYSGWLGNAAAAAAILQRPDEPDFHLVAA